MQSILGNSRKADIVFRCSGQIDITAHVARLLNLQHGDIIDIICDRDEWYLYVKHRAPIHGRHKSVVFRSNKGGVHSRAWSRVLCAAVLKKWNEPERVGLCVGRPSEHPAYGITLPIINKYKI